MILNLAPQIIKYKELVALGLAILNLNLGEFLLNIRDIISESRQVRTNLPLQNFEHLSI